MARPYGLTNTHKLFNGWGKSTRPQVGDFEVAIRGAGEKLGFIRGQIQNAISHIFGFAEMAHRMPAQCRL
jgi:hypothetical protein